VTVDYVESSALAKLVLGETEEPALRAWLVGDQELVTSLLAVAEVRRAVNRAVDPAHVRDPARLHDAFRRVTFLAIDRQVIDAAARLQPTTLRTLDAIHVASALQLGSEVRSVVTYDRRLAAAALAAGLPVASPGADLDADADPV